MSLKIKFEVDLFRKVRLVDFELMVLFLYKDKLTIGHLQSNQGNRAYSGNQKNVIQGHTQQRT